MTGENERMPSTNELYNELARKNAITLPEPSERRRLREFMKVPQTRLAAALNVSRRTVHAWEHGEADPTGENRERYAELLALWQVKERENRQNKG